MVVSVLGDFLRFIKLDVDVIQANCGSPCIWLTRPQLGIVFVLEILVNDVLVGFDLNCDLRLILLRLRLAPAEAQKVGERALEEASKLVLAWLSLLDILLIVGFHTLVSCGLVFIRT